MRWVLATLFLAVAAVLQVSVFSRMTLAGAAPQLVLLSVIAWSLVRGSAEGMYWGFAGGLLYDFASGGPLGVSALGMLAVAAVAGLLGGRMFGTNPLLPVLAVVIASGVFFVIDGFLLATLHYPTDWKSLFVGVAFPTAVANGLLSLAVYPIFAWVAHHTSQQLRVEF